MWDVLGAWWTLFCVRSFWRLVDNILWWMFLEVGGQYSVRDVPGGCWRLRMLLCGGWSVGRGQMGVTWECSPSHLTSVTIQSDQPVTPLSADQHIKSFTHLTVMEGVESVYMFHRRFCMSSLSHYLCDKVYKVWLTEPNKTKGLQFLYLKFRMI